MLTKRTLGVGYLVAVGVGLFGALGTGLLLPVGTRPSASGSVLAVFSLFAVAGGFTLAGVALARGEPPGDRVWRVAAWATLGLGVPTLLLLGLGLFRPRALAGMGWRSVAVVDVASGGVVGVLAGMVVELRAERDRARTLDQRNAVFRRLFRHDVRTNVHVVRGHLELLTEAGAAPAASVEAIEDGLDRIERLSEAARRLDELDAAAGDETVDLAALVRDRVATLRERHPAVTVETDVEPATVAATGLLGSVVDNVLENAVEHAGERPTVRVSVAERSGRVELRVRDDGPGFAASELAVHERATETAAPQRRRRTLARPLDRRVLRRRDRARQRRRRRRRWGGRRRPSPVRRDGPAVARGRPVDLGGDGYGGLRTGRIGRADDVTVPRDATRAAPTPI